MRQPLTDRQREIYVWVRTFLELHQRMPTVRETAGAFEFSVTAAQVYMQALERKGWLTHEGGEGKSRAWKLAGVRVVLEEVV
jgi:SOS-response transcriptional repressor LexA